MKISQMNQGYGPHVPEQAGMPPVKILAKAADEYITISVAEYHWLTKAAAMLEVIMADKTYCHDNVVAAVRNAMADMVEIAMKPAEVGGEE